MPTSQEQQPSFGEVKASASKNIGQLLQDLQSFEHAIETENVAEIYRIYQGKLHKELKETSNQNHEIDNLLARKLHDALLARFEYLQFVKKISPTLLQYRIGQYYHQRPTIMVDVSVPKIYIEPTVLNEWRNFNETDHSQLEEIEQKINQLDVQNLTLQSEVEELEKKLLPINKQIQQMAQQKTIFNRVKNEEEYLQLLNTKKQLEADIQKLNAQKDDETTLNRRKEAYQQDYFNIQLHRALITKELRLVQKYATSLDHLEAELMQFITDYLLPREEVQANDKGF